MSSVNYILERCVQAGIDFWLASKVALELKESASQIREEEIDEKILSVIKKLDENAAVQYENYFGMRVRTSKNVIEPFERKKITESIVKETGLPKLLSEEIAKNVEEDLRRLQLRSVTSALLREMVNAKLIEKKLLEAKINYSRIGLPLYDVKEIIEKESAKDIFSLNEVFSERVLSEYTLMKVLTQKISNEYLEGNIDISFLGTFSMAPVSLQSDLRFVLKKGFSVEGVIKTSPAKHPLVAASHAARFLINLRKYVGGGVGLGFFNLFLAPYLDINKKEEMKQVAQTFLYELNREKFKEQSFSIFVLPKIPKNLFEIELVLPEGKTGFCEDYVEEAEVFFNVFIETLLEGDAARKSFMFPEIGIVFDKRNSIKKIPRSQGYFINWDLMRSSFLHGCCVPFEDVENSLNSGILQSVSINVPKISSGVSDERVFFEKVEKYLGVFREIVEVKKNVFLKKNTSNKNSFNSENWFFFLSFVGLPESANKIVGKENETKFIRACLGFSKKILSEFEKEDTARYVIGEVPGKEVINRFNKINERKGVPLIRKKIIPDSDPREVAKIQKYCNGGAFFEAEDLRFLDEKELVFLRVV